VLSFPCRPVEEEEEESGYTQSGLRKGGEGCQRRRQSHPPLHWQCPVDEARGGECARTHCRRRGTLCGWVLSKKVVQDERCLPRVCACLLVLREVEGSVTDWKCRLVGGEGEERAGE